MVVELFVDEDREFQTVQTVPATYREILTSNGLQFSGVLTCNDTRWHSASSGSPLPERTDFGPRSLQLDRPTYAPAIHQHLTARRTYDMQSQDRALHYSASCGISYSNA